MLPCPRAPARPYQFQSGSMFEVSVALKWEDGSSGVSCDMGSIEIMSLSAGEFKLMSMSGSI